VGGYYQSSAYPKNNNTMSVELLAPGNIINKGLYVVSLNIFSLSLEGYF
jgi:hypothetical protein